VRSVSDDRNIADPNKDPAYLAMQTREAVNSKVYMPPAQHVWNRFKTKYSCNGTLEEEEQLGLDTNC